MRTFGVPLLLFVMLPACYHYARPDAPSKPASSVAGKLVAIPPGGFLMGDQNGEPDEYPERHVTLSGFRIEQLEVTNLAYRACVDARACDPTPYLDDDALGADNHPVVGVTWLDAQRFCKWLGRRLPTEAEWEYAARGPEARKWPWKGPFNPENANSERGDEYSATAPVGSFPAGESPFGLLDMAGNAGEWVADYYDPTWLRRTDASTNDPVGPSSGRERVVRGGSYRDSQYSVRGAARRALLPTESDSTVGVRCAADGG